MHNPLFMVFLRFVSHFLTLFFCFHSMPAGYLQVNPGSRSVSTMPSQQPLHSWSRHHLCVPQRLLPWWCWSAGWTLHEWVHCTWHDINTPTMSHSYIFVRKVPYIGIHVGIVHFSVNLFEKGKINIYKPLYLQNDKSVEIFSHLTLSVSFTLSSY